MSDKKPTVSLLAPFAMTECREELEWYRNWVTGEYNRYRVVTFEVWEALLDDDAPMPATFLNPGGKAVGAWRCEDRSLSDPWGSPLRRTYQETWIHRGGIVYV